MSSDTHTTFLETNGGLLASAFVFAAAVYFVWAVLMILFVRKSNSSGHPFELQRLEKLREGSPLFRWCEPLVLDVEWFARFRKETKLKQLEDSLIQSRERLPWNPSEFFATKVVEGMGVAMAVAVFVAFVSTVENAIYAVALTVLAYPVLAELSVRQKANARAKVIKSRLPYAVDLMALTIQAGASFQQSLETFVEESVGHPLGDELGIVLEQIEMGRPRNAALASLSERVKDGDIDDLVFAINQGEELGTPITSILQDQANQMQLKRSQWGEKAAAEAGVKVIFPGMLIVVACLLAVLTPFALPILEALK